MKALVIRLSLHDLGTFAYTGLFDNKQRAWDWAQDNYPDSDIHEICTVENFLKYNGIMELCSI